MLRAQTRLVRDNMRSLVTKLEASCLVHTMQHLANSQPLQETSVLGMQQLAAKFIDETPPDTLCSPSMEDTGALHNPHRHLGGLCILGCYFTSLQRFVEGLESPCTVRPYWGSAAWMIPSSEILLIWSPATLTLQWAQRGLSSLLWV